MTPSPPATTHDLLGKNWEGGVMLPLSGYYTVVDDRGRARTYQLAGSGFYAVYGHTTRRVARYAPGLQRPGSPPSIPVVYVGPSAEAAHAGPLASLLANPEAARVRYALADPARPRCARCTRPAPNAAAQGGFGADCLAILRSRGLTPPTVSAASVSEVAQ